MNRKEIDVVWFKRLEGKRQSTTLLAAKRGLIAPIFIFEPELWKAKDHSYRHYVFLKDALQDLNKQLTRLEAELIVLVGSAVDIFNDLNSNYQINTIFSHQETWNLWTYNRDKNVKSWARK